MTTSELDLRSHPGSLQVLPPMSAASPAVTMLREHADLMDMAYSLAEKMCRTKLVPTRFFGKPQDGTAAILYGLELGLNPIQSLQRVIPIHGMPTLESLTMVALLEARGYTIRTIEESDTVCEVHGWKPGRDPDTAEPDAKSRWTIERAVRAGYVPQPSSPDSQQRPTVDTDWITVTKTWDGKPKTSVVGNMKYITDPQTMLTAKCQARVCKAIGSAVLLGIAGSTEEVRSENYPDDEPGITKVESQRDNTLTVDEVIGDPEAPVKKPSGSKLGDKIKPTPAPDESTEVTQQETRDGAGDTNKAETEVENTTADPAPGPQTDPGQEQSQGAEPSAGATLPSDPADQETPHPEAKPRNARRAALESRLFGLIGEIKPKITDDERITMYRAIVGRPGVKGTDYLSDREVGEVSDQLFEWQQAGGLDAKVRDIINAADSAAAETEGAETK